MLLLDEKGSMNQLEFSTRMTNESLSMAKDILREMNADKMAWVREINAAITTGAKLTPDEEKKLLDTNIQPYTEKEYLELATKCRDFALETLKEIQKIQK
jgi:hypothetical protein